MKFAPHILDEIRSRLRVSDVVARRVKLKRQGREFVGLSPFKTEKTPSFTVNDRKGFYHCFATGEHGDIFKFLMTVDGLTFPEAVRRLASEAGVSLGEGAGPGGGVVGRAPDPARAAFWEAERRRRDEAEARDRARRMETARGVWEASEPAEGTLAEVYWRARGVNCDALLDVYGWTMPPAFRFHPALPFNGTREVIWRGPAVVAAVTNAAGELISVHRTWLAPDGGGRAELGGGKLPKRCLGTQSGGMIIISDARERSGMMGEGPETTATPVAAAASRGQRWWAACAVNLGNMAGPGLPAAAIERDEFGHALPSREPDMSRPWLTLPGHVGRMVFLLDADGKSPSHALRMTERAANRCRRTNYDGPGGAPTPREGLIAKPTVRSDFNDMARCA